MIAFGSYRRCLKRHLPSIGIFPIERALKYQTNVASFCQIKDTYLLDEVRFQLPAKALIITAEG